MTRKLFLLPLAIGGMFVISAILFAAFQNSHFKVIRSTEIKGESSLISDSVFQQIASLKNWKHWSPWQKNDPEMQIRFEGKDMTPGSKFIWSSKNSGNGELTLTEISSHRITYHLVFKDWDSESTGEFLINSTDPLTTQVTWTMEGKNRFFERILWLIFRFQKSIEKDFDQGLQHLKTKVESELRH